MSALRSVPLPSGAESSCWPESIEIVSTSKSASVSCCSMRLALGFIALFEGGRCRWVGGEGALRPGVEVGIGQSGVADAKARRERVRFVDTQSPSLYCTVNSR